MRNKDKLIKNEVTAEQNARAKADDAILSAFQKFFNANLVDYLEKSHGRMVKVFKDEKGDLTTTYSFLDDKK